MDMRDQAMSQQLAALKSELVQTESQISVLEKSLQHTIDRSRMAPSRDLLKP